MTKSKHSVSSLEKILNELRTKDSKDIPLAIIIEAFAGKKLLPIKTKNANDKNFVFELKKILQSCVNKIEKSGGIESARVNEVGNKIEQPVIDAINNSNKNLQAERPLTASGKRKSTGYPDILIWDAQDRPTYLEVKTYDINKKKDTTFRSFYLSPSEDFKVIYDARHLLVAFGVEKMKNNIYKPQTFELIDLYKLKCAIKFEVNSNNKNLYAPHMEIQLT